VPRKPPKPCAKAGCGRLTTERYCDVHRGEGNKAKDARRGSSAQRGYDARWRRYRKRFLRAHPLCELHQQRGDLVPATVVDHIVPHRGDTDLFWDPSNHQALCKRCHDAKTAGEVNTRAQGGVG